ncbi:MAG: Gldg family protein [Ruminococcus sp.]|nr:Gldg family protein [Ruminococcus sp.]
MFCLKCGKKLEKPGICRFCGEDNTIVSEDTYSGSPEIYVLLRDEEELLSEILNDGSDIIDIALETSPEPEVLHAAVDEQIYENTEPAEEPETEEKAYVPAYAAYKNDEASYYKETESKLSLYDRFLKYKRWIVIALAAFLVVILFILMLSSCGDSKDKNKNSDSAAVNSSEETTKAPETTSVSETTAITTITTTTALQEENDGTVNVAVVKNNPENADIAADIVSIFENNGYVCKDEDLSSDDISAYDMVVIPMPTSDLSDTQIGKLRKFLETEDKNLVYIPALTGANTPKLNSFLEEWDIGADNEGNAFFNSTPGCYQNNGLADDGYRIMLTVDDAQSAGGADYSSADICAPDTKEIYDLGKKDNINVTRILGIPENSMLIIKELTAQATENSSPSNRGAVVIAEDVNNDSSHVIVFGSGVMFSSEYTSDNQYANKDVILGILNNVAGVTADGSGN